MVNELFHVRQTRRALFAAALACALSATMPYAEASGSRLVELTWQDGRLTGDGLAAAARGAPTLRLRRGERIELRVTSDRPLDLHLHGYDIETRAVPGHPAVFAFLAHAAGRFAVETHDARGRHVALLYVEVHP